MGSRGSANLSPLSLRHAKCLVPIDKSFLYTPLPTFKNPCWKKPRGKSAPKVDKLPRVSPKDKKIVIKNSSSEENDGNNVPRINMIAQIRSLPLQLSHIRDPMKSNASHRQSRSSYVVNSRAKSTKDEGRTRSLSPEILRTSGKLPLRSPGLVRSASVGRKLDKEKREARMLKSQIPIKCKTRSSEEKESRKREISQIRKIQISQSEVLRKMIEKYNPTFMRPLKTEKEEDLSLLTSAKNEEFMARYENGIVPISAIGATRKANFRNQYMQNIKSNGQVGKRMTKMNAQPIPLRSAVQSDLITKARSNRDHIIAKMGYGYYPATEIIAQEKRCSGISIKSVPPIPVSIPVPPQQYNFARGSRQYSSFHQMPHSRGFPRHPPPSSTLYDDDPGIMSEAETASTGFRRGGKARSSLPVVRTPSKTLERPLGLVFLQYRGETKRALLPNEITSIDTVKALFVRSFPKQLTMEYLDAMNVKIYIHDTSKDMFYELEELRDVRDRSVLRLFEPNINGNGAVPSWDQDQSYFSEPECDSDYQHQHIHKPKGSKTPPYMSYSYPISATLPRVTRPFSPGPVTHKTPGIITHTKPLRQSQSVYAAVGKRQVPIAIPQAVAAANTTHYSILGEMRGSFASSHTSSISMAPDHRRNIYSTPDTGYVSSPERRYAEDPYYGHYTMSASGAMTPVVIDDESRARMEYMERQLENLTGLVQKALVTPPPTTQSNRITHASSTLPRSTNISYGASTAAAHAYRDYIPTRDYRDDIDKHSSSSSASLQDDPIRPSIDVTSGVGKVPKFGKEKSVSFSDDPPDFGRQHSPSRHPVEKPAKSAIKSSTLPRVLQDRSLKIASSPASIKNQAGLNNVPTHPYDRSYLNGTKNDVPLDPEMYNQLRILQKKARELKGDVKILRRSVQTQAHTVKETIRDTFMRFKVLAMSGNEQWFHGDPQRSKMHQDEELYKQEIMKLDKDLSELEKNVEDLRSHVINKRTRVNMSDVENMALILSKSSKSVADLKARFPSLQDNIRNLLTSEKERMLVEEKFLQEEPERLEIALKRCKKLTGTLVTLKRLASVQEQRVPSKDHDSLAESLAAQGGPNQFHISNRDLNATYPASPGSIVGANNWSGSAQYAEAAFDDLLNELGSDSSRIQHRNRLEPPKRLPSYPSTESGGSPVRHWDSPVKIHPPLPPKPTRIPPPPPPRTSSKSPVVSPSIESNGSGDSGNSQECLGLSHRHQELLQKQRILQDQYNRLQEIQHKPPLMVGASATLASSHSRSINSELAKADLKKTGSESNLRARLGLEFSAAPTGSLSNINKATVYETDIL